MHHRFAPAVSPLDFGALTFQRPTEISDSTAAIPLLPALAQHFDSSLYLIRKTITPTFLRFVPLTHSSAMETVNAPPKLRTASDIHLA
jgi:hypothetical protein